MVVASGPSLLDVADRFYGLITKNGGSAIPLASGEL
jgi:hypothetical protein